MDNPVDPCNLHIGVPEIDKNEVIENISVSEEGEISDKPVQRTRKFDLADVSSDQ